MSSITRVNNTPGAPPVAAPYSQATIVNGTIYCSGQVPANADGKLIEGSIQDKTRQCIENLGAVLRHAGSDLSKIVKVNVFLDDMANFAALNEEYAKHFAANKPARSCVAVKQLPLGVPVEIECIAIL